MTPENDNTAHSAPCAPPLYCHAIVAQILVVRLTNHAMSRSRDGPGVTGPFRTNIVPLTGVWNPPPSLTPPLKKSLTLVGGVDRENKEKRMRNEREGVIVVLVLKSVFRGSFKNNLRKSK